MIATAAEIAEAVRSGSRAPDEVVEEALDRIAALNPAINALIEVRPPEARAAARKLAERISRGEDPGPLAGVPVAIKDVVWEAGIETTDGSRALLGFVPEESATVVTCDTAARSSKPPPRCRTAAPSS